MSNSLTTSQALRSLRRTAYRYCHWCNERFNLPTNKSEQKFCKGACYQAHKRWERNAAKKAA